MVSQLPGLGGLMGDKCLCVPSVRLCVLGSDLLSQCCCAGKPYKVLNSFGQPCPPLQFWDIADSGPGVCWVPWGPGRGWPWRVLGNGYSRKLSQPGRRFCGNRKELGCCGTGGKRELHRAVDRGSTWGLHYPARAS